MRTAALRTFEPRKTPVQERSTVTVEVIAEATIQVLLVVGLNRLTTTRVADRSEIPGYQGTDAATSTVDHIAFEIPLSDFADEKKRLETLGLQVETAEHGWVNWRSLYVTDPEGNQVELVCYDGSV